MSTRDDFEAVVWRVAGRRLDRADVARILAAADAYAAAEGGLTAERRRVLAEATGAHAPRLEAAVPAARSARVRSARVHFAWPDGPVPCGRPGSGITTTLRWQDVTCGHCRNRRDAAAEARTVQALAA